MAPHTPEGLVLMLREYLSDKMSLSELSNWVDGYDWPFDQISSPFADNLAMVELAIHELADWQSIEEQMNDRLAGLLQDLEQPVSVAPSSFEYPRTGTKTAASSILAFKTMTRELVPSGQSARLADLASATAV